MLAIGGYLFSQYWYYLPGLIAEHPRSDPAQSPG